MAISLSKNWRDLSGYKKTAKIPLFTAFGIKGATVPTVTPELTQAYGESNMISTGASNAIGQGTGSGGGGAGLGKGTGANPPPAPMSSTETAWFTDMLKSMGAPVNSANLNSLAAWYNHENRQWPPSASNNPLNTTLAEPGATTFNSVNVRNYPTSQVGLEATIATLNGGYPNIVAALKAGRGICGTQYGGEFLKWSGNGYSSVC